MRACAAKDVSEIKRILFFTGPGIALTEGTPYMEAYLARNGFDVVSILCDSYQMAQDERIKQDLARVIRRAFQQGPVGAFATDAQYVQMIRSKRGLAGRVVGELNPEYPNFTYQNQVSVGESTFACPPLLLKDHKPWPSLNAMP